MPEESGVEVECPACDYETLLFPESQRQREQMLCGLPRALEGCPNDCATLIPTGVLP